MNVVEFIRNELQQEAAAITQVAEKIDQNVGNAVDLLYKCKGKVIVTGMGKTGIIARKIASTFASTGTTAIFLHAAEGVHGDLGVIDQNDIVMAVSYSGNTSELLSIVPYLKFQQIPIIALTGNLNSELAKNSDVIIDCKIPKKLEPFGLVPTASTTVALAVGDAIAVALLKKRNFQQADFARFHPGGTIGKRMLYKVKDLMHTGDDNPLVKISAKMDEVILEMTTKGLGCTNVIDETGILVGIVTDGDLRRFLASGYTDLNIIVTKAMTKAPKATTLDQLAVDALNLMEENKITMLPVVDEKQKPIGMLHMHDLINAGVVG